MTGTSQYGQMDVWARIETAEKSAQIGADSKIRQFPPIQGQTQCHAAIVALIAIAFRLAPNVIVIARSPKVKS